MKERRGTEIRKISVLNCIIQSEPNGIGVREIAKKVNLNKETAGIYCKLLQKHGLIWRKTKVSKYHLTDKARGHPALLPFSIATTAYRRMLDWSHITQTNKFCNDKLYSKKMVHNLKYIYGNKEIEQAALFEFSNRIGAFITYNLLRAVNPKREIRNIDLRMADYTRKGNDETAMRWMDNAVKPGLILHEFCNMAIIERGISSQDESYIISEKAWKRLMNSFKDLYPDVFTELESLKTESLEGIEAKRSIGVLSIKK